MSYSCVSNGFYFSLRSRSGGRSAQTYEECWNLNIFSRLSPFLQFFWQVKEAFKLELYGMIEISHVVACLKIFILHRQGRVVKEWEVLGVSYRGQFKAWITLNSADIVNLVSNCFSSMILGSRQKSVLVYWKWYCFRDLFHFKPFSQFLG